MSEQEIADPVVTRRAGPSIVWLIPLVTALVGGWLMLRTLTEQAPAVTITFETADGIEAGKTRIKYKSVDVGLVEEVTFAEGFEHVILSAVFNPGTEELLRRNTRFWVVRPQLTLQGVSGLGTLVSGTYIEIDPGPGARQDHFVGLEEIPLVTAEDTGSQITLITDNLGSISRGSPIYYQGIIAGEALGYELGSDARSVYIHAFIRSPFDQLVRGNTRFWNVSGVDLSLTADGVDVRTASMQSLLFGGIAFETPDSLEVSAADVEDLIFTLHPNRDSIEDDSFVRKLQFVLYFAGSVRGLSPGAPVEFKGIRIGEVLDIRLELDSENMNFRIPVLVEIEPDRIIDRELEGKVSPEQTLARLVEDGLRARLQTGNLLTGQLFVELNMYPGTPVELVAGDDVPYPQLPTIPGALETMTGSVTALLSQLEQLDVEAMGHSVRSILEGTDELVNQPVSDTAVTDLQSSLRSVRQILQNLENADVEQTVAAAEQALQRLNQTLTLVQGALDPNEPLQYNVIKVTEELEATARAIRSLVQTLERQPQSLIFGRSESSEEPR